jgi:predicted ATPase
LPAGEERMRLFDHVTRFLQNLAGENGLLVWIDDLHWADQGTLALLSYILRNLHNERVLVLAAYREIELDRTHPLAAALVEWTRERVATRISLSRLTFAETTALLETLFGQEASSEELPRAVYVETEGNPFFIEEVVKTLIEQGQVYREKDRWERMAISEITIPQSIKEAIGRRLNRLSADCLDALHAAAVLGKEFEFVELAAGSNLPEDQLLDALDEAGAAQLIKTDTSSAFSFTHDKVREVLYEELNPIRRKRLHQRIGEALEDRYQNGDPGVIPDLANHFTQSGDLSRSLKYALLAAENASRLFALDDALGYYEIAHEAAESRRETSQLAAIHKAIGEIHSQRGQVDQSVHYFQRAIDLETDPEARGALKARMGSVYTSAGDAHALPLIEAALHELNPDTQADEVALATAMIGRYYHYQCFHWKAIEYLQRARLIAEPLGNPETLKEVYAYLAGAYQHMTQFGESMAWAERNIALGREKNDPMAEAYGNEFLAEDSAALGDWVNALRYSERDMQIGQQTGAQNRIAWAAYCRAIVKHGMGELAAAEQDTLSARKLAENMGDIRLIVFSGGLLVQVLADLGRQDQIDELGEQSLREADDLKQPYIQALIRHYYAYALLQQNQPARALALYQQAEDLIRPTENRWAALA